VIDLATFMGYLPLLGEGALTTLWLTAVTLVAGLVIAVPVALCRNSERVALRSFALSFVFVFRGAPLLALLFMIYYGGAEVPLIRDTPLWILFRDPIACAVIALSLNSAGYLTEIIAGALRAVPRGQIEGALALGLSKVKVFWFVEAPSALRSGLRAYGTEVVGVIKGTSVASLVTVSDTLAAAQQIYYQTFDPLTPLLAAAAIYLAIVGAASAIINGLERRLRIVER
jgi:His/Glu/Gln/Arg/opine family amino acid ABC transporter permease subunit